MDDYTPSTEEVEQTFARGIQHNEEALWLSGFTREALAFSRASIPERMDAFDRWLAAHDRGVAANAWDEGFTSGQVDMLRHEVSTPEDPCTPNPYRITEENN